MQRISVVVTTYRRNDLLREALISVAQQTQPVHEVVVVDDGGDGSAATVVQSFGWPFRYVWQPNGGMQSARNLGIAKATGEWIAFLDDDDLWLPNRTRIVAPLLQSDEVDVVTTNFVMFNEDSGAEDEGMFQRFSERQPPFWRPAELQDDGCSVIRSLPGERLLPTHPFWPSTIIARKSAVERIGGWSVGMKDVKAEDIHFVFRLFRNSNIGIAWSPCLQYRVHAGNTAGTGLPTLLGRIANYEALLKHEGMSCTVSETQALQFARDQGLREAMWLAYQAREFDIAVRLGDRITWSRMCMPQRLRYVISRLRTHGARLRLTAP